MLISFGPSPPVGGILKTISIKHNGVNLPTTNRTLGNLRQILGAIATKRSIPLRYAKRETKIIVTDASCQYSDNALKYKAYSYLQYLVWEMA